MDIFRGLGLLQEQEKSFPLSLTLLFFLNWLSCIKGAPAGLMERGCKLLWGRNWGSPTSEPVYREQG